LEQVRSTTKDTSIHDAPIRRNTTASTTTTGNTVVTTTIPLVHRKLIRIQPRERSDDEEPMPTRKQKKLKKQQKKERKKKEKKDHKKQKKESKKEKKMRKKKGDIRDDDVYESTDKYSRTDDTSLGTKKITTEPTEGDHQFYYYSEEKSRRKDDVKTRLRDWITEPLDFATTKKKEHNCSIS